MYRSQFSWPDDAGARRIDATHVPLSPALVPRSSEQLMRLESDLRLGLPVVLRDAGDVRLVVFVEPLTEARYAALAALGHVELVLTRRRAETLGIAATGEGDAVRVDVPAGASLDWSRAVIGQAAADDLPPGDLIGNPRPGGCVEAAAVALAKAAQVMPAALTVPLDPAVAGTGLMEMHASAALKALRDTRAHLPVSSAGLPMDVSAAGRVHVFRPDDGGTEHYAIEVGTPDLSRPVTVRLHSACFTGDVLGSLKCDCGPQLRGAMAGMAETGGGVLLYLNQEGRGIGLANKMRAYALQEGGLDTVEANHWLGFEDDQRDFRIGADILRRLGIARIRLMTNNPAKIEMLQGQGLDIVERVPLKVGGTAQNAAYLATKMAKSGHLL